MWSTLRYGARLLSLFWSLLGHRKRSFVGMVGLGLLGAALDSLGIALVVPFLATLQGQPTTLTSELLAGFTQEHTNPLLMIAVAVGAVFLIKNAVVVTRIRWSLKVLYELWHGWVATIFTSIVYAPAERTEKEKPGVLLAVTLNHSSESINALRHVLDLTVSGLTLCAIYAVLLLLSWPATLAASVLMAAFGLAVVRPLSRKAHRAGSRFVRAQKAASVTLLEALGGFRYVKAFRRETAFENRMAASVGELERSFVDAAWAGTLIHPLVETVVIGFFVAAVWVLTLGGAPAVANALPLLGAFAAAAFRLFPVVSSLGAYWVGFISKESSARSLRESLEPREPEPTGAAPFRALGQSVELERVSFAYEGRPPALSGVTMRFERGKRTALVGESGAGKSTIVGLLLGFLRPQTGSVRVDGRPLSELRLDAWRAALGYVGQDGFTFSATLAENVTLGRIPEDDPRILEVLEVVGLGELAATLPRGLRTELGERGSQLSGGQRQRVALARALLLKPSLLLLDEATSALDNESAAATLERTSTFASGSTVVSVGHRLSHTRGYDTIYVLRDGKVVEHGAHDELMLRRGYYARLFAAESRRQAKPVPEEATLHGASNETP